MLSSFRCTNAGREPFTQKPNILYILADDHGYGDLSRYGGTDIHSTIIGKWHLGLEPENHPCARGFDVFRGFLGDTTAANSMPGLQMGRFEVKSRKCMKAGAVAWQKKGTTQR
ncbi:MAG: hypothetical protein K9N51_06275 [Candidatus Pacebacteria bacterium]|nr:hypothetical protein [Candidatus Paceibacterota bacterium]